MQTIFIFLNNINLKTSVVKIKTLFMNYLGDTNDYIKQQKTIIKSLQRITWGFLFF